MFKLLFPRAPSYPEIVARRLADAEILRLDAEAEFERASAERARAQASYQRLSRESETLHAQANAHPPRPVRGEP